MWEWLREHPWPAWLGLGLLLAAAEMLTLDLTLLMLAGGALAGGAVALVAPDLWIAQVVVALLTSVLLLFVLRPTLLAKVRSAPGYRGALESLVGSQAIATTEITENGGEVKVGGMTWTAQLVLPGRVPVGSHVEVQQVEGTTLKVYALDDGSSFPTLTP